MRPSEWIKSKEKETVHVKLTDQPALGAMIRYFVIGRNALTLGT